MIVDTEAGSRTQVIPGEDRCLIALSKNRGGLGARYVRKLLGEDFDGPARKKDFVTSRGSFSVCRQ